MGVDVDVASSTSQCEAQEVQRGGQGQQTRISGQQEDPARAAQGSSGTWERQQLAWHPSRSRRRAAEPPGAEPGDRQGVRERQAG